MSNLTTLIITLFGIVLGSSVLLMGKHALLSQETFLRLYNRWQKTGHVGMKPFDVDYFGGPRKLEIVGSGIGRYRFVHGFISPRYLAILLNHF
jgi:hypothetical protein